MGTSATPVTASSYPAADARGRAEVLLAQLEADRKTFDGHWTDLARVVKPRRGRFFVTDANRGERRNKDIIVNTATIALRTFVSGIISLHTNPSKEWFWLQHPDPEVSELDGVKHWLHQVRQRINTVLLGSNFYQMLVPYYSDLGLFGTAAVLGEQDDEEVIRFRTFPLGSYAIANDARGRVRVFGRQFVRTVRQVVEEFCTDPITGAVDLSKLSDTTQRRVAAHDWQGYVTLAHLICPSKDMQGQKMPRAKDLSRPFASYYWEVGTGRDSKASGFLRQASYDRFPVFVSRWERTDEDAYATDCPGMTALGDIRQLQLAEKRIFQGIEKQMAPPLVAPPGMRNQRLSWAANDVTFSAQGDAIRPLYEVKMQLDHLEAKQQQCAARIREAFYADHFLMFAQDDRAQPRTAREIDERASEKVQSTGPVVEQVNQDFLSPVIDFVFGVLAERGMLPPAPPELEGVQLRVEYVSQMAAAQRMVGVGGMERYATTVIANAMNSQDPSMLDKLDLDQWNDEYAAMLLVPPTIVRSDDAVEAIRAQRAQAQQARDRAETAKLEADAIAKVASIPQGMPGGGMGMAPGTAPAGVFS